MKLKAQYKSYVLVNLIFSFCGTQKASRRKNDDLKKFLYTRLSLGKVESKLLNKHSNEFIAQQRHLLKGSVILRRHIAKQCCQIQHFSARFSRFSRKIFHLADFQPIGRFSRFLAEFRKSSRIFSIFWFFFEMLQKT